MADGEIPPARDDARDTRSTCLAMVGVIAASAVACVAACVLLAALYFLLLWLGLPVN